MGKCFTEKFETANEDLLLIGKIDHLKSKYWKIASQLSFHDSFKLKSQRFGRILLFMQLF